MVSFHVVPQGVKRIADYRTQVTPVLIIFQATVNIFVGLQVRILSEPSMTKVAFVGLLTRMYPLVFSQVCCVFELR